MFFGVQRVVWNIPSTVERAGVDTSGNWGR
jgi:hypothetical protein